MTEMTQMFLGKEGKRGREKIHIKTPPFFGPSKSCVWEYLKL